MGCGYIYDRFECAGLYFEEQSPGFRCPQCSGPRRRYAKKVGDRIGTTLDGGDGPILLFFIWWLDCYNCVWNLGYRKLVKMPLIIQQYMLYFYNGHSKVR